MTEYEIIADPKDYGIEHLVEGLGGSPTDFPEEERRKWAREISAFAEKLDAMSTKARNLERLLESGDPIKATPASLKTLKIQLFRINEALDASWERVNRLECDIVSCD
jgi:hypothetical protein